MLILLSGSDSYRLNRATADVLVSLREQHGPSTNVFTVDGSEEDAVERIERPLKYPSFFDEKKLIVVTHAAGEAMADVLKRYPLSKLDDVICVAVQLTTHESCDKKVLAALVKAADRTESFEPLAPVQLAAWIQSTCGERTTTIELPAVDALIQRTGGNMQLISNELDKLCSYARERAITPEDVRELVPARYEQDEWELSNALAAHDKRAAIAVLWRRLQEGVSEQLLLASLAAGLRNLTMVKDMQIRRQPNASIASATGLHPFVVSKTARGASAADAAKLRRAHVSLAQLDRDAKDGRADAVDGMFTALLSL